MLFNDGGASVFDGPISSWSNDQVDFMSWAKFYNVNYFSLPEEEKPSENLLKYSPLLDQYIERKAFKKKSEATKERMKSKGKAGGQSMRWDF